MSYGVGAVRALSYSHSAVIGTGMVFIYVVLVTVIPESPRWLVIKGHNTQALKVLWFLRRSHECAAIRKLVKSRKVQKVSQSLH